MENTKQKAKLVCQITGQSRQSSHKYIAKKAEQYGVDSDTWRKNYVSKSALLQLTADLSTQTIGEYLSNSPYDGPALENILKYNGKSKKTLDDFKGKKKETPKVVEEPVAVS
jgi:hypothetical protein